MQHLGDHWREYDAALRADKCPVVPCSAGLAYMSDVVSHCGSDQRKRIEADYVQEREEHEEWHRDRGDTGAVPDDGPSGDGGSGDGGSGKGGSSKGGFGKLSSGKGGSGKGGSGKGGSGKGGSDTGGSNNQDSVGDTPPDEGSPPPKPEDLQGESEDLNNEDEEVRSLKPREEAVRLGGSHSIQEEQPTQEPENQPEQPEGTESENDDDQPPIPPSQPTKTTGTKKGKPTVQCCAVCFTQLKSLKGAVRPLVSQRRDMD